MLITTNELAHHGILGQKWGVRRFQNKDGSLTEAGKKRLERKELKRDGGEYQKKETEFNKEMVIAKGDYEAAIKHLEVFTDQELDTVITRAGKQAKLKEFTANEIKKSMDDKAAVAKNKIDKFKRAVDVVKNVSDMATSATNLYNSIAKASNAIAGTDFPVIGEKKETNRGVTINKNVTYEDIPGISGYVKKVTNTTTENKDGTTSRDTTTEWVAKGNQGLGSVASENKENKEDKKKK